ncbi:hypothetical protein D3C71_1980940 [compost metagenome]
MPHGNGQQRAKAPALGAEPVGGDGEGVERRNVGKAIDTPCGIEAQDDGVGDIQRQRAAGKSVCGPGEGHA